MPRGVIVLLLLLPALLRAQPHAALVDSIRACADTFGGRIGATAEILRTRKIVEIDADSLFPTATIIELPVLVELFWKFHDGELAP